MATLIQLRRGTEAEWTSANPTLAAGEVGISLDVNKIKIGNGSTSWSSLPYASLTPTEVQSAIDSAISNLIGSAPEALDTLNELAAALGDDPNFLSTLQSSISTLQSELSSSQSDISNLQLSIEEKADLNSPTFTGYVEFDGVVDFTESVVLGIDALPDQTGQAGKFLTTDGMDASWADAAPSPHPFSMIG
jgi:hypothetical protein